MKKPFPNPEDKYYYPLFQSGINSFLFLLLISFFSSISGLVPAQTIVKEANIEHLGFGFDTPFNILGVNTDGNSLTLYVNQQRGLFADDPKTKKPIFDEMNQGYPTLYVYSMDRDFNILDTKIEGVHLSSLGINKPYILQTLNNNVITDNARDKTYEQLASQYPGSYIGNYGPKEFIELNKTAQFKNYGMGAISHKYILDNSCNTSFDLNVLPGNKPAEEVSISSFSMSGLSAKPNEKTLNITLPVENGKHYSLESPFVDILRNSLTLDVYVKRKDAQKNDEFKEHYLLTYGKDGRISNNVSLTFSEPLEIRCKVGIVDKYIYDTIPVYKGYIFIYGTLQGLGRRIKDADNTKYEVIYLDSLGRKVFQYKFKFGNPKTGIASVHAFESEGIVYLLAKEGLDYSLIRFGKDSILSIKQILRDNLYKNSKEIPAGTRTFADISEIRNLGSEMLQNKDIVLYGTSIDKMFNTLFLNVIHLSNTGDLINSYCVNFKPSDYVKKPLQLDLVYKNSNKLVMMYKKKMGLLSDTFQRVGVLYSYVAKKELRDPDYNFREHPVILTLDAEKRKLDIFAYDRPYYTSLSGRKYFDINVKDNSLLLFGINTKARNYPSNLIITKLSLE